MLNYTDVQTLRQQGQTNRQILEMMATTVPSAKSALDAIDSDKTTPQWQIDSKIGEMIDRGVPKNTRSGIPLLNAININKAQEQYNAATAPEESPIKKYKNPEWISNILSGLKTAATAPGEVMQGVADVVGNSIGEVGRSIMGKNGPAKGLWFDPNTEQQQNLAKNAVDVLNNLPTYGTVIGAPFGLPGVGAAVGQLATEVGHNIMGDNPNTLLQQASDVALAGLAGKISGGAPTSVYGTAARSAVAQGVTEVGKDIMGNNPSDFKTQLQNVAGAGLMGGTFAGLGKVAPPVIEGAAQGGLKGAMAGLKTGVADLQSSLAIPIPKKLNFFVQKAPTPNLDSMIDQSLSQAIRPSKASRGSTLQEQAAYRENQALAVKDIVAHDQHLELKTYFGEERPTGALPESLWELQQANSQMLDKLFTSWDKMKQVAEGKGVTVPTDSLVASLNELAADKTLNLRYPQLAKKAEIMAQRYARAGELSLTDAQKLLQTINADLDGAQQSTNLSDKSVATIYALEKNVLGKTLSDAINAESSADPIYSELKRRYAAQKSIQDDIGGRISTYVRQNPQGLIDYTNISTAGDIMKALGSLDPSYMASAIGKMSIKNYIKTLNDPNNIIKNLFREVKQSITDAELPILDRASSAIQNMSTKKDISKQQGQPKQEQVSSSQSTLPQETSPVKGVERVADRIDSKLGMVDEGLKTQTTKIAGIPDELQGLAQEARKYKSAEEFLKGQEQTFDNLYRGLADRPNDFGVAGKGEYWSGRKQAAQAYAQKSLKENGKLTFYNPLKLLYGELNDLQTKLYGKPLTGFEEGLSKKFHDYLIQNGYDGVLLFDPEISTKIPEEVVKLSNNKAKSQLTDLWNKAHSPSSK